MGPIESHEGTLSPLSRLVLTLIYRFYKLCVSPFLGAVCRFNPSCSDYSRQAIEKHGWIRGGGFAIKRLCRCHPWDPGGNDPVPPTKIRTIQGKDFSRPL